MSGIYATVTKGAVVDADAIRKGDVVEIGQGFWWKVVERKADQLTVVRFAAWAIYPIGAVRGAYRL